MGNILNNNNQKPLYSQGLSLLSHVRRRIRTLDLLIRSQTLYPAELCIHITLTTNNMITFFKLFVKCFFNIILLGQSVVKSKTLRTFANWHYYLIYSFKPAFQMKIKSLWIFNLHQRPYTIQSNKSQTR